MPDFNYQALTPDRELKTGQISAASAAEAIAALESQELAVLMIRQVIAADEDSLEEPVLIVEESTEEDILRERVGQMLENRDTLAPALTAFAEEMPWGRPRRQLKQLASRLTSGATVDELVQSPKMTPAWLPLIGSGASLGSKSFLHDMFAEASRENAVRTQRARVLAYPLLVCLMALAVLVLLCVIAVPTFADMFIDFDLILPGVTWALIGFAKALQTQPILVLLSLAAGVGIIFGLYCLAMTASIPGVSFGVLTQGSSRQVTAMASFVRHLAESLHAGIAPPAALRLAASATNYKWLNRQAAQLAAQIEIQDASRWYSKLPPMLLYALRAGPGATPNIRLLEEIAQMYTDRVHARTDWSSGILPHFAIGVVGFVVGVVVLALYVPLVQLINGLTG